MVCERTAKRLSALAKSTGLTVKVVSRNGRSWYSLGNKILGLWSQSFGTQDVTSMEVEIQTRKDNINKTAKAVCENIRPA